MAPQSDLSELEQRRLENIQRNSQFLISLGISSDSNNTNKLSKDKIDLNKKSEIKKRSLKKLSPIISTRSSKRLQALKEEISMLKDESSDDEIDESDGSIHYDIMPIESDQLDDYEFEIYAHLKAWRLEKSRELEIETYKICQNRTLAEFIRRKRNNINWANLDSDHFENDLLECWGIGPSKARKPDGYGAEMMRQVSVENMKSLFEKSREVETKLIN